MIKHFCDRCDNEIMVSNVVGSNAIRWSVQRTTGDTPRGMECQSFEPIDREFCDSCVKDIERKICEKPPKVEAKAA